MSSHQPQSIFVPSELPGPADVTPGNELLSIRTREEATRTWVTPAGELDLATGPAFDQRLTDAQSRCRWVMLDLRALTFIDASGLRSVLAARLRAAQHNHRFEVLCKPGQVARMLAISGFDQLLDIKRHDPAAAASQPDTEAVA